MVFCIEVVYKSPTGDINKLMSYQDINKERRNDKSNNYSYHHSTLFNALIQQKRHDASYHGEKLTNHEVYLAWLLHSSGYKPPEYKVQWNPERPE